MRPPIFPLGAKRSGALLTSHLKRFSDTAAFFFSPFSLKESIMAATFLSASRTIPSLRNRRPSRDSGTSFPVKRLSFLLLSGTAPPPDSATLRRRILLLAPGPRLSFWGDRSGRHGPRLFPLFARPAVRFCPFLCGVTWEVLFPALWRAERGGRHSVIFWGPRSLFLQKVASPEDLSFCHFEEMLDSSLPR